MSSALNDSGITNNGLVGLSSASQIGNENVSTPNSANDDWLNAYKRDWRSILPSWTDWFTGYDRAFENTKYEQWLTDTSIQRRVADAKLAGINPLFAISGGSGADSVSAPKSDTSLSGKKVNVSEQASKFGMIAMLLKLLL